MDIVFIITCNIIVYITPYMTHTIIFVYLYSTLPKTTPFLSSFIEK